MQRAASTKLAAAASPQQLPSQQTAPPSGACGDLQVAAESSTIILCIPNLRPFPVTHTTYHLLSTNHALCKDQRKHVLVVVRHMWRCGENSRIRHGDHNVDTT